MDSTKERIKKVVREYIRAFPVEYENFLKSHRVRQYNKQNKFAEIKGGDQLVRHLVEIPESLYMALRMKLEDEQFNWLYSVGGFENSHAGMSWFMKTFPQFKVSEDF